MQQEQIYMKGFIKKNVKKLLTTDRLIWVFILLSKNSGQGI